MELINDSRILISPSVFSFKDKLNYLYPLFYYNDNIASMYDRLAKCVSGLAEGIKNNYICYYNIRL